MGTVGIVVGLILRQFLIDGGDRQGTLVERVELIATGAVGALHTAIIFGFFRGQHIQGDVCFLAGLLKLIPELRTAVHLQGTDGKRRLLLQVGQKPFGIAAGGPTIHLYVVKAIWTVARPIEETVQLIWLAVSCRS